MKRCGQRDIEVAPEQLKCRIMGPKFERIDRTHGPLPDIERQAPRRRRIASAAPQLTEGSDQSHDV